MIYLDTSYIAKCYLAEPGSSEVLAWLEGKTGLTCCLHGRLEFVAAVKRHAREGRLGNRGARRAIRALESDEQLNIWHWTPITEALIHSACDRVQALPDGVFLRSADALHLTCAAEHGFDCIYSHDTRLLAASAHFGLDGRDIL